MNFSLYGGAADGALVPHLLGPADHVYLVRMPREDEPRVFDVLAYSFANRTDARGNWVLQYERYIGFRGMPSVKPEEEKK